VVGRRQQAVPHVRVLCERRPGPVEDPSIGAHLPRKSRY
jgi:hypothetical protein